MFALPARDRRRSLKAPYHLNSSSFFGGDG